MEILPLLLKELDQEAQTTRKFFKLVTEEHFDWQPHPKSMTMKRLAVHIAELPSWVAMTFNSDGIDFATTPYEPTPIRSQEDLIELFEKSYEAGKKALEEATEEDLLPSWTMKNDGVVLQEFTKYEVIRHSFGQTAHHRAQLGVNLRLLDIPIPGSYGPSADETF